MNFSFFRMILIFFLSRSLVARVSSSKVRIPLCVCVRVGSEGCKIKKHLYSYFLLLIYCVPLKHLRFQMKEMDASFIHIIRCTWVSSHAISCLIFVLFQFVNLWFVWEKLCFDKRKNLMCFPISNYIGW